MSHNEDNPFPKDFPTELVGTIVQSFEGERNEQGQFQGEGVATFLGGNSYTGSFVQSLMHGKGKYKWSDGVSFEGDFAYNSISGFGTYNWPNSPILFKYEGGVKNGLRHGNGVLQWEHSLSGLRYEGSWSEGKRDGEGTLYFNWPQQKNTNYYKGHWKRNQKDGFGIMYYPSGNIYTGEWKQDKKDGNGRMVWKTQKSETVHQIYQGEWKNGLPDGMGCYYWLKFADKDEKVTLYARRNYYKGNWKAGKRNGNGTFYYADGGMYSGEWKDNLKHGNGKFVYADGRVFEGRFENDRMVELNKEKSSQPYVLTLPSFQGLDANQIEALDRIIRQHLSKFKDIFKYYSSLGYTAEDESLNMSILQFFQFLKDAEIHSQKFSLAIIQNLLSVSLDNAHDPNTSFLFREFIDALVNIAIAKYRDQETLANSFATLINQNILSCNYRNRAYLKKKARDSFSKKLEEKYREQSITAFKAVPNDLTSSNDLWNTVRRYQPQLQQLYNMNSQNGLLSVQDVLIILRDRKLFDSELTIDRVTVLFEGEIFQIEQKITFFEFAYVLVNSALIKHNLSADLLLDEKVNVFLSRLTESL